MLLATKGRGSDEEHDERETDEEHDGYQDAQGREEEEKEERILTCLAQYMATQNKHAQCATGSWSTS